MPAAIRTVAPLNILFLKLHFIMSFLLLIEMSLVVASFLIYFQDFNFYFKIYYLI